MRRASILATIIVLLSGCGEDPRTQNTNPLMSNKNMITCLETLKGIEDKFEKVYYGQHEIIVDLGHSEKFLYESSGNSDKYVKCENETIYVSNDALLDENYHGFCPSMVNVVGECGAKVFGPFVPLPDLKYNF